MPVVSLDSPAFSGLALTFKLLPSEQKDIIISPCQTILQYILDISLYFGGITKVSYRILLLIFGHRYLYNIFVS